MVTIQRLCVGLCVASALIREVRGQVPVADSAPTLEQRIEQLEAREAHHQRTIAELQRQLRSGDASNWLDEQRAEEVRNIVLDVLADADGRVSLLQDAATAGWDNGFFIRSADGNFALRTLGQIQFRYVYSMQDNSPSDDHRAGFEHHRIRVGLKGHIVDPTWNYFIWSGWDSSGTSLILDAFLKKGLGNGWSVQAGQFKSEAWREWTVTEMKLQFVERSLIDARYAVSYTQGVALEYVNDDLRVNLQLHDGIRTRATAFSVPPGPSSALYQASNEYAFGVRAEYKLHGAWPDYGDWEGWTGGDGLAVIGGSLYVQEGESGTTDEENDLVQWSLDASLKWDGASLFAAVIGTSVDDDAAVDRDEFAFLIQGGCFLADDLEIMARYEYGDLDGAGGVAGDDLSILTLGVSRYWARHALKWTTDLGYAFEPVDDAWGGAGRGWRGDAAGEDGQIVIRSQFNLLF